VWYEFESDAHDTVSSELIMAQVPMVGLVGVVVYTPPAARQLEEAHARHVELNHAASPITKYYTTPLRHDVPLSIMVSVKISGCVYVVWGQWFTGRVDRYGITS